jgi:hypothetical protein
MDIKTFSATCKLDEGTCTKVLDDLGFDASVPFAESMATPLQAALTAAGGKLFPILAVIEALKKEAGIGAAPSVPAPVHVAAPAHAHGPIQVTVVSDKPPMEMREHELLTALSASPRDREIIKAMEARDLKVVAIDGALSTALTLDMWNAVIEPSADDEFWIEVQNRIVYPSDLGSQMVLLCPVTLEVLRGGTHQRTHTKWGANVEALTAARWASTAGKLGRGDVIAQHAAWVERETALVAEFDQKCKMDPNLRPQVRAQVEQLHSHKRSTRAQATRKVTRGGTATVDDSEGRLSTIDQANFLQEELTNRMHDTLCRFLPSEFDLIVFRVGIPSSHIRRSTQSDRASDVINYMLTHGRLAELTLAITRQLGSDKWLL